MDGEPFGKVLPRILLPYLQQWAERSGFTLLSRLLVDDQFRGLIETYGDELLMRMAQAATAPDQGRRNGAGPRAAAAPPVDQTDTNHIDLTNLQDRVIAMEAQQEVQQALFERFRAKARPLALALGCCPDCLVGVEGCAKCWGQSRVAHYPPDYALLEARVVRPLVARGVPLVLNGRTAASTDRRARTSTTTRKGSRAWPRK